MPTRPLLVLSIALLLASCRSTQPFLPASQPTTAAPLASDLPVENMAFERLMIKGKGKFEATGGKGRRFKYRVHVEHGKRLWISIVALGVEGIRMLAMPDSLVLVNRLDETYYAGSYDWLSTQTGLPLSYQLLEDAVVGNVHAYTAPFSPGDPYAFGFKAGGYQVLYQLNNRLSRPELIQTLDSTATPRATLQYRKYKQLGTSALPYQLILKIEGGPLEKVDLEHKEVDPSPGELPFSVRIPRYFKPVAGS